MTVFLVFIIAVFVAGFALPPRLSLRLPVAALGVLTAIALMSHRFA